MHFPAREFLLRQTEVLDTPRAADSAADAEARRIAAAISRGDDAAFRELYDRYHQRVFRLVLALTQGDEPSAHDIVQAVMLTAASRLKPVSGEEHLWNWLAQVARQKLGKFRRGLDVMLVPVADVPETAQVAADSHLEERLEVALSALDEPERRLVEMFYFEGMSQKEIAKSLALTPKAVSSRLERARARLRESIVQRLAE